MPARCCQQFCFGRRRVCGFSRSESRQQRFVEAGDKHSEHPYLKARSLLTNLLSALEDLPSMPEELPEQMGRAGRAQRCCREAKQLCSCWRVLRETLKKKQNTFEMKGQHCGLLWSSKRGAGWPPTSHSPVPPAHSTGMPPLLLTSAPVTSQIKLRGVFSFVFFLFIGAPKALCSPPAVARWVPGGTLRAAAVPSPPSLPVCLSPGADGAEERREGAGVSLQLGCARGPAEVAAADPRGGGPVLQHQEAERREAAAGGQGRGEDLSVLVPGLPRAVLEEMGNETCVKVCSASSSHFLAASHFCIHLLCHDMPEALVHSSAKQISVRSCSPINCSGERHDAVTWLWLLASSYLVP